MNEESLRNFMNKNIKKPQQPSNFADQSQPEHFVDYNFSAGLNVDSAPEHMKDSELRQADNLVITQRGGIAIRENISNYATTSYDNITQLMKWPRKDGSKQLLAVVLDGSQYKLYDVTNTTEIHNIDSSEVGYFIFKDEFYFLDGNNYYKYDSSSVTQIQNAEYFIFVRSQTGDFQIGETVIKDKLTAEEGSLSGSFSQYEEVSGGTSSASAKIAAVSDSGNELYIYDKSGTFDDGETITSSGGASMTLFGESIDTFTLQNIFSDGTRQLLGVSLSDGSFGYYSDRDNWIVGEDSHAFASYRNIDGDYDTSLSSVKNCKYAVRHTNSYRFFFAGDNTDKSALYYSEPNQPNFIKATSILYPTEAEGPIVGLTEMMGYLVVSYENGDWVYTGVDPAQDAQWKKIPTRHGAHNQNVITLTNNSLTTYGDNGIYVKNPSILGQDDNMVPGENFIVNIAKNKVEGLLDNITDPKAAVSVYDPEDDFYYLAFCDDGTGTNNKVLVYNWMVKGFTLWTGHRLKQLL
jgi:hypothetical protein